MASITALNAVVLVTFYNFAPNSYMYNQREIYSNYMKGMVYNENKISNKDLRSYSMTCAPSAIYMFCFL